MTIFIEPDITAYPDSFQATRCAGLEALTGADMVISQLPIPPTNNLSLHIATRSLFVQIKIGYDVVSFDQLHSSIARMQACKIPKNQAVLLPVGEYWQGDKGLLRIRGEKAFGNTSHSTLGTIYDMWAFRGGTVEPLPPKTIDGLQEWIERKQHSLEKIESEGKRDIYPPTPVFEIDDIWQQVEEIRDWRKFLVCGLDGFGSKKANAIFEYASENYPGLENNAYQILCLMTDEDEKGKPLHKILLWGNTSRKEFRSFLGIPDGWNLPEVAYRLAFYQGWQSFGKEFKRLVDKGGSPKEIHTKLMKEIGNSMTNLESQIPF